MYDKNDKRRLYQLIDLFLAGTVTASAFCNDFHDSLVNEMYYQGLTDLELNVFKNLLDVVQRFSEYEEDHKLWTGFTTEKELKEKIIEAKERLTSM